MADELTPIAITELPESGSIGTTADYVPVVHYSEAYQTGMQTVKVHPSTFNAYDNKKSKLNARNYQDAIDEIVSLLAVGETFSAPLAPNPNANEIKVITADVPIEGE